MNSMSRSLVSGVLLAASVSAARAGAPASSRSAVPFIEDDYPRALEQARSRNLPIFVENWAPW
jgi:L-asparagine transporter-like permease